MNDLPLSREQFLTELEALRARFDAMDPELEVTVRDPELGVEGYVVVWNTGISRKGPLPGVGKGGTRVARHLNLEGVKRLARSMAEKNAAAGLPLGGAKSGLKLDPADPDYEQKYRRFVQLCAPLLHENGGTFGGFGYDVGGIPPLNAVWACDQLGSTKSFTGKPVELGGTNYDVEGTAGLGVAVAARALLANKREQPKGKTFAVQGIGAMGAAVIRYFSEFGGILQCVSDPKLGGTWTLDAAPSDALIGAIGQRDEQRTRTLLSKEAKRTSIFANEALTAEVDVLFPCALEDAVREETVDSMRARFISEGANNAITSKAYEKLFAKGVGVVPDIIANPGGIIAAFVELSSTLPDTADGAREKIREAKDLTISRITANVQQLLALTDRLKVRSDQAARYLAYRAILADRGS